MFKFKICLLGILFSCLLSTGMVWEENTWVIKINIPEFKLYLFNAGICYRTFPVAVGKSNTPSPQGDFWIANKVVNPTWYPPDGKKPVPPGPKNPLGKYWLGLNKASYGIHGNNIPWSIGTSASSGCFRLRNKDIQELYNLIPIGTPVLVTYETVNAFIDEKNLMWLELFPDVYHLVNQEEEIRTVIESFYWIYSPHWSALNDLIKDKNQIKVEVPRVVKVEGDYMANDCFSWSDNIYLAINEFRAISGNDGDNTLFPGYLQLDLENQYGRNYKYLWDKVANTLKICPLRLVLNGRELPNSIRWNNKQVVINLKELAKKLGAPFSWDGRSAVAICNKIMIPGADYGGRFWVQLGDLTSVWPEIEYDWNQETWVLAISINNKNIIGFQN